MHIGNTRYTKYDNLANGSHKSWDKTLIIKLRLLVISRSMNTIIAMIKAGRDRLINRLL